KVLTVNAGAITSVQVQTAGSYTAAPAGAPGPVAVTPVGAGTGTGAMLDLVWTIEKLSVLKGGSYSRVVTSGIVQDKTTNAGTGATFDVVWGVGDFKVVNPGDGYTRVPAAQFSGGGGAGASASAVM